jgi:hypothetical protein
MEFGLRGLDLEELECHVLIEELDPSGSIASEREE